MSSDVAWFEQPHAKELRSLQLQENRLVIPEAGKGGAPPRLWDLASIKVLAFAWVARYFCFNAH